MSDFLTEQSAAAFWRKVDQHIAKQLERERKRQTGIVPDVAYSSVKFNAAGFAVWGGAGGSGASASYAYLNSGGSISNNSLTTLDLDGELFDVLSCHSNVTNPSRMTVPSDGLYIALAQVNWAANATGRRELVIKKNDVGGLTTRALSVHAAAPTGGTVHAAATIEYCLTGDYYRMDVRQTSGGTLSANTGDGNTFFVLAKIG